MLKEYAQQGNKEAEHWLQEGDGDGECFQIKLMHFDLIKEIAKKAMGQKPSDWWEGIWKPKNR